MLLAQAPVARPPAAGGLWSWRPPPAIALLIPVAAAALQMALWDLLRPLYWVLFFPAAFLASWLGGRHYGRIAILVSALLVLCLFVPHQGLLPADAEVWLSAAVYVATGLFICEVLHRLRLTQRGYRGLIELQGDAYWRLDEAGRVLEMSNPLPAAAGLGASDAVFERIRAHCEPREVEALDKALAGLAPFRGLRVHGRATADREPFVFVLRGAPLRDARGRLAGWHGTVSDVTREEKLERQLLQKQKLDSIGELTGGLAHDFNNLLTVIMGNAEALGEQLAAQPRLQPLAATIVNAAQSGADLTRRLTSFAREQSLSARAVDVNALVHGMKPLLRRTIPESITITRVADEALAPALVDPSQLESALLNLCLNARDAMPDGGQIRFRIENATIDAAYVAQHPDASVGEYVCVTVNDTGTGIAPEHLQRVFEPFFTTKDVGRGSGLGLSMVYGLVRQSGGHVTIYSELGHGTSVKLYLPTAKKSVEPEVPAMPPPAIVGGSETVLLVEDSEPLRLFAEQQLRDLGYPVIAAVDGASALDQLRAHPDVRLLFTDVVMPGGMSGAELAQAALTLRPDLRVLYTSGYTENAVLNRAGVRGALHILAKPYRRSELAKKLRAAIDEPSEAKP